MSNKIVTGILVGLVIFGLLGFDGCGGQRLRVATTTSLYDSGLWGYLEPMFEEKYNVELDVLALGSGAAFAYGRRGDVDVLVTHDRAGEEEFIADGYGIGRVPFAYNYFLIVGPPADPAQIKGLSPEDALRRLFEKGGFFVSRGDDSGTHAKEKEIWAAAGLDYELVREAAWYIEGGKGMGPTLLMASERQAYTLTDIGTYLAYKGRLELEPMVTKGGILLNVYCLIAVNPQKVSGAKNLEMANRLIDFLTSPEVQELIGNYGVKEFGVPLFIPCAGAEPAN